VEPFPFHVSLGRLTNLLGLWYDGAFPAPLLPALTIFHITSLRFSHEEKTSFGIPLLEIFVWFIFISLRMEAQAAQVDFVDPEISLLIHCLTNIQPSAEDALRRDMTVELPDEFHVEFIPWGSDKDGTEADILRIYKKTQQETGNSSELCFFADQQSCQDLSLIIVYPDLSCLLDSDDAAARAQQLVEDLKWEAIDYEIDEGLREGAEAEFLGHAITYGRICAYNIYDAWLQLETGNLSLFDLVEGYETGVHLIPDPDWDGTAFLKKVEELKKREREWSAQGSSRFSQSLSLPCSHKSKAGCQLTAVSKCCACADKRPEKSSGLVNTCSPGYCPACVGKWKNSGEIIVPHNTATLMTDFLCAEFWWGRRIHE